MFLEVSRKMWFGQETFSGFVVDETTKGRIATWILDEVDQPINSAFNVKLADNLNGLEQAVISRTGIRAGVTDQQLLISLSKVKTYTYEENGHSIGYGGVDELQQGPKPLEDLVTRYRGIADLLFTEYDKNIWKA